MTISETVAKQVRAARTQRGWTVKQFAARCAEVGAPELTTAALYVLEGPRRRNITVDELLALACALNVMPVDLLVPADAADGEPYKVAPNVTTTASTARDWIAGLSFLKIPETPAELAEAIQGMPKDRAQALARMWFTPQRMQEWNRAALDADREAEKQKGDEE